MAYFANGSEGEAFEEENCSRCVHSDLHPDKQIGDSDNPPCPIWIAHQLFAYDLCNKRDDPGNVILDMLIPDVRPLAADGLIAGPPSDCAMFHPRDTGATIRGQLTIE